MKCPDGKYFCNDRQKCMPIPKGTRVRKDGQLVKEVAPPGFGHTKGDDKGGTAAAFNKARKEGRFKGSKSDMFAIMWSQKNKGDKPHYKPGTDKKYKKYEEENSYEKLKKKIGSKEKHMKPVIAEGEYGKLKGYEKSILQGGLKVRSGVSYDREMARLVKMYPGFKVEEKEMTYQEAIDAGWEMTGEGIWWPPQSESETVSEKMSFKSFRGVLDKKKKKEEKKPDKAMDAGSKARRVLQRKEYKKKVGDFIPKELEDQKQYPDGSLI